MKHASSALPIRRLVVLVSLVTLAVSGITLLTETAWADIGDDSHLGFNCKRRPVTRVLCTEEDRGPKWITRNVVDGQVIPVYSVEYPNATKEALARWNTALGVSVFRFAGAGPSCQMTGGMSAPSTGVPSVIVSKGAGDDGCSEWKDGSPLYFATLLKGSDGKIARKSTAGSRALAGFEHTGLRDQDFVGNGLWQSYWGTGEIVVNPSIFDCDKDPGPEVECDRNADEVRFGRNLAHDIAHELGHILGLADYYCQENDHPDYLAATASPDKKSLLNSSNLVLGCDPSDGRLTLLDKTDYRTAYLPAAVTMLAGEAAAGAVTLTWDQSDVFVEADFEIQRAVDFRVLDPEWVFVGTAPANAESVRLFEEPGGWQRYRVVGRTKALPPASGRAGLGAARRG